MRAARDDAGAVLATVALVLPLLVLMASFVIDVANWFEHRRHLQTQADAGALAAAGELTIVPRDSCDAAADDAIEARAREFAGIGEPANVFNEQVGGTPPERVHFALNSRTWPPSQEAPVDDTVVEGSPCSTGMIDVKLAESDLPWYFRAARVPFINTHARVEIRRRDENAGSLPIGVPDVRPRRVAIQVVDERTGSVLATRELEPVGEANGLAVWDNATAPVPVEVRDERLGVRAVLSGGSSTTCGEPLVECYDVEPSRDGNPRGIVHVRGWSAEPVATGGPPRARSVRLDAGSCPDAYFSAASSTCSIGVEARVDFNASAGTSGGRLKAVVARRDYALTLDPTTGVWRSDATIPVEPASGPLPIELVWEQTTGTVAGDSCRSGGGNKCTGSFGDVQRTFAATGSRSGPVKVAQVLENGIPGANSLERCSSVRSSCTYDLVFRLGLEGRRDVAATASEPPEKLRLESGSRTQALDCDPAAPRLRDELAHGCVPEYARNTGTACPSREVLWGSQQPWTCVAVYTGSSTGHVASGLNERILGDAQPTECTAPNNWSSFPALDPDDPRIVEVFMTSFGAFGGSGGGTVPVVDFGTFYVTGWTSRGSGFRNPCTGNGDDEVPEDADVVGHFIKYVQTLNDGTAGEERCNLNGGLGSCVAVLTE